MEHKINNDLILREKLAIQRTVLSNQTTLLAFIRTSLYFLVAGLSIDNLLKFDYKYLIIYTFYLMSLLLFIISIINFFLHKKKINKSEKHVGNYKQEFENEKT